MTFYYLVRHAATDQLGRVLTGRAPGVHLSGRGRAQAKALAARLASGRLDAIYASPQPRAWESAELPAAMTGLSCQVSRDLDEIDFGAWEGLTFEALEADPAWRRWNQDRDNAATPAGETMRDVAERLTALIGALHREFPGGRVALFSHSDVIKAGICRYRGLPFQSVHDFEVAPASVSTIAITGGKITVLSVNSVQECSELEAVA